MRLKEEVAALRSQVLEAKAMRLERNSSASSISSREHTDDLEGHMEVAPQSGAERPGPDLWGAKRPPEYRQRKNYLGADNSQHTRGQCLAGKDGRTCFPVRHCG